MNIKKALRKLDLLVKEITDILTCGIDQTLDNIGNTLLCSSTSDIVMPASFVNDTEKLCEMRANSLSMYVLFVFLLFAYRFWHFIFILLFNLLLINLFNYSKLCLCNKTNTTNILSIISVNKWFFKSYKIVT